MAMLLGGILRRRLRCNWAAFAARPQQRDAGFGLRYLCQQAALVDDTGAFWSIDESHPSFGTLWDRISSKKDASVLKEWMEQGNEMPRHLFNNIILKMCSRCWERQAQKMVVWMDEAHPCELTDDDLMIQLEVHSRSLAPESRLAAEECFNKLSKKTENAYIVLLRGYVRRRSTEKAEQLMTELLSSDVMATPRAYTTMLRLYARNGQDDKAAAIYHKYRESQLGPDADMCLALVWHKQKLSKYIPVETRVKAELKKLEVTPKNRIHLLRLYGDLGDTKGVKELWETILASPPVPMREHVTAISAYGKVGDLAKAEELSSELEPNLEVASSEHRLAMLQIYCKHGLLDKAEAILNKMQPDATFQHCHLLVEAYLRVGNHEEALQWFNKFAARGGRQAHHPHKHVAGCMSKLLESFAEKRDVKGAEDVMAKVPEVRDPDVYNWLMRVYINARTPAKKFHGRMQQARVTWNEETRPLLQELEQITC